MHTRLVDGLDGYAALLDRYVDSGPAGFATFQNPRQGPVCSELKWTQAIRRVAQRRHLRYVKPH